MKEDFPNLILLMFQFLIGRLGTERISSIIWRAEVFQFLIGRLGT